MELLSSGALELTGCSIKPARAELSFSRHDKKGIEEKFQRLGMLSEWFDGNVENWLDRQVPYDIYGRGVMAQSVAGHEIKVITGRRKAKVFPSFRNEPLYYEARAWVCPGDNRLYGVSCTGKRDEVKMNRLSCCGKMALDHEK